MLDKSLPFFSVIMTKDDMEHYPRFELSDEFYITGYQKGFEKDWAEIEVEQLQINSVKEAEEVFWNEFGSHPEWLEERCLFVVEKSTGRVAAMTAIWEGGVFGEPHKIVHWVATREEYQGRGIIKALLTRILDMYHELGGCGFMYLITQTWSYKAINIYKKFGFEPYIGNAPAGMENYDKEQNIKAWQMIDEKIAEYASFAKHSH